MFSVIFAVCLALTFVFSGARVVYRVKYSGKDIAIVEKKEAFDNAKRAVIELVEGENVEAAVETPEYIATISLAAPISKESEIVDAIIDNTEDIVAGSVLNVDGNRILCAEKKILSKNMEDYLKSFDIDGEENNSYFIENIKIDDGYFLKADVADEKEIKSELSKLNVITEVAFITDTTIPCDYTEVYDGTMIIGTRKTVTEGTDGINRVIKKNIYLNGVLKSEEIESETVVVKPQDGVVMVGTLVPNLSSFSSQRTGSGLVFPLATNNWNVGAYFGDGRGHKGIDLCASAGVPILAAQGGTVTLSQWYYGYGNCVIIDHGNGLTTLYGHASQLLVSVGQQVSAGDPIALVGSTGDSTGNHLHFEISINGNRINPAPYLGLG